MDPSKVDNIPKKRKITYGHIVVEYIAHKNDPNRLHITAGNDLITYPENVTTSMANILTSNKFWNSVLITKGAQHKCIDIKFYLCDPMDR